jgi:hypothetical protein
MDGQWILTNIKSETCTLTVSRGPYKWGKSLNLFEVTYYEIHVQDVPLI